MDPLSPFSYHRRHKGRAAILLSLSILITAGLYLMVVLLWTIFIEHGRSNYLFLSRFSVVTPQSEQHGPDPGVIARIRSDPDVANVIPAKSIWIALPGVMEGSSSGFSLLGLNENDVLHVLEKCGATLERGQLLRPQSNGLMLSEEVAASLSLQVGDTIDASKNSEFYGSIVTPLEVVGILKSDVRLCILSLVYLNNHEAYSQFLHQFLVVAHENRMSAVDAFLRDEIQSTRTNVQTFQLLNESMAKEYLGSLLVLVPIITIVTIVFTLVIVVVNWISNSRRLPEFGVLRALGYSKTRLIQRLSLETATLTIIGWMIGIGLSLLILSILKVTLLAPKGQDLPITILVEAVVLTILIMFYEIIMRYIFNNPTRFSLEAAMFLQFMIVATAGAYILKEGGHVSIGLITEKLGEKAKNWLLFATSIIGLFYCVFLCIQMWATASWSLKIDAYSENLGISIAPLQFILIAGLILLALQFIVQAYQHYRLARGKTIMEEKVTG